MRKDVAQRAHRPISVVHNLGPLTLKSKKTAQKNRTPLQIAKTLRINHRTIKHVATNSQIGCKKCVESKICR